VRKDSVADEDVRSAFAFDLVLSFSELGWVVAYDKVLRAIDKMTKECSTTIRR
jgi:hypothetical protein